MSSFMTMFMINKHMLYEKNQTGPNVTDLQVLITSFIMGTLGFVFAYFALGFKHKKNLYNYLEILFLVIQIGIVVILIM